MPRQALAVAISLAAALAAAPGHGATGTFPAYVSPTGRWQVTSDHLWKANAGVTRELKKMEVPALAAPGESTATIWSSQCTRGAQTVAFTRTLQLPGTPAVLSFEVYAPSTLTSPHPLFTSASLVVNGAEVATIPGGKLGSIAVTDEVHGTPLRHFRLGENTVQVVFRRAALPAAAKSCSNGTASVEAAFGLDGSSQADLGVTAGPAKTAVLHGTGGTINFTTSVAENLGPSAALPGTWTMQIQHGFAKGAVGPVKATAPFGKCAISGDIIITCPFSAFPAGDRASVTFSLTVILDPGSGSAENDITLSWRIVSGMNGQSATFDPNSANDSQTATFYLCPTGATDPRCA